MSNGQTGPHYPAMASPMYTLSPVAPPLSASPMPMPMPPQARAACAGCAANYGATIANNDYGRTYNAHDRGFQGPVFGNGVFASAGRGCASAAQCGGRGMKGCGKDYAHPATHQRAGHVGCGAPKCTSNAAAVSDIYARDTGKYVGCGSNAVSDRLLESKMANAVRNWTHRLPKARYTDIVKEFGEPDWVVNKAGGEAVWLNRAFYTRIVLRDESVAHASPKPHCDFLYATIGGIDLPREGIDEVFQISKSLSYDQLKKELTARCHAMGPVVATLLVALDTALDDDLSLAEAKEAYPRMIADTADPAVYVEMAQALEENVMEAHASLQNKPNFKCT